MEHALPAKSQTDPRTIHPQFRRARVLANGNYLAVFLNMNKVTEFDKGFKPVWSRDHDTMG